MPSPLNPTSTAMDAKAAKKEAVRTRFLGVWERIRDELLAQFEAEGMSSDAIAWTRRSLDYNTPHGKLNRGISVVDTMTILKGAELNEHQYFRAAVLGWCVELMQACFLVSDDLMDDSITRRGQPCWYLVEGVGKIAINDALVLEGAIFQLLKTHFRRDAVYVDLLEMFHDVMYKTEMGQTVDLITAPQDSVDLSRFSLQKHRLIVVYKTAYYSFYLPVALAMLMHGIPIPAGPEAVFPVAKMDAPMGAPAANPYQLALDILIPLGEYFQVQDDFLDYSGTPEQIGKVGTDIVDNKCSWVVNVALAAATPAQRAVLDANYGKKDARAEQRVKDLYEELGMPARYARYEEDVVARILAAVNTIPPDGHKNGLKREVFTSFLDKIYKRTK